MYKRLGARDAPAHKRTLFEELPNVGKKIKRAPHLRRFIFYSLLIQNSKEKEKENTIKIYVFIHVYMFYLFLTISSSRKGNQIALVSRLDIP